MFLLRHYASSLKASDFRAYEANTVARPQLASLTTSRVRKGTFNRPLAFLLWVDVPTRRYFSIISSCYPRAFSRLEISRIEILGPLNGDTKDLSKTTTSSSSNPTFSHLPRDNFKTPGLLAQQSAIRMRLVSTVRLPLSRVLQTARGRSMRHLLESRDPIWVHHGSLTSCTPKSRVQLDPGSSRRTRSVRFICSSPSIQPLQPATCRETTHRRLPLRLPPHRFDFNSYISVHLSSLTQSRLRVVAEPLSTTPRGVSGHITVRVRSGLIFKA
jgi:hypothetical protein